MKNIRIFSLVIAIIFMVVSIAADIAFYFTHKPDDILADEIAVSNGNRILQEKGFALQAWFPAEESDEKQISFENLEQFGFGPTYYHGNLFHAPLHQKDSSLIWSMAKAPNNVNALDIAPSGREWMSDEQLQYVDNLISVCFGDEQSYSTHQAEMLGQWFDDFRSRNNNVLLHSNQWASQWSKKEYEEYMRIAKPDMLTYDSYYFDELGNNKDYRVAAVIADDINRIRIPAMKGYDGSGSSPIPFGQYLLGYKSGENPADVGWYEITESQKKLVANLTVTMGGKWLNLFRVIDSEQFLLFDGDGNQTHHYQEYAQIAAEIKALSPHLVNLQTENVQVLSGKHKLGLVGVPNLKPSTVSKFSSENGCGIKAIEAHNLGTENDSLPGDVYIGYFRTLPGADKIKGRNYFIVCNALTSGNGLHPEQQHGSSRETAQSITLTFGESEKKLFLVNGKNGQSEKATLENGKYTFELGGGEMQVFYLA